MEIHQRPLWVVTGHSANGSFRPKPAVHYSLNRERIVKQVQEEKASLKEQVKDMDERRKLDLQCVQ
jgi:hypothetical protein